MTRHKHEGKALTHFKVEKPVGITIGMMLLMSSDGSPRVNHRAWRFIFISTGRPESDLTEHPITQQFHNTKVTKATWGKRVFIKRTDG